MADAPVLLADDEIEARLRELPDWAHVGQEITKTFHIRYHGGVALIVHIAGVERLIAADFDLARRIDATAQAHRAEPAAAPVGRDGRRGDDGGAAAWKDR